MAKGSAKIEWDEVRRAYESRAFTPNQLAVRFRVPKSTLYKKIKEEGWGEGVASKIVARRTQERLVQESSEFSDDLERAIELTAATNVQVVLAHRTAAGRGRTLAFKMLAELEEVVDNVPTIDEIIGEKVEAGELVPKAALWLRNRLELGERISNLKELSIATKNWIELERQAFGLDRDEGDEPELTEAQVDARLRLILGKAERRRRHHEAEDDGEEGDSQE